MDKYHVAPIVPTEEMLLSAGKSPSGVSPRGGIDWLGKMLPKYYAAMMTAAPNLPPGLLLSLGDDTVQEVPRGLYFTDGAGRVIDLSDKATAIATDAVTAGLLSEATSEFSGRIKRLEQKAASARSAALEEARRVCTSWIASFGEHEILHVTAAQYARDAVADIADAIAALRQDAMPSTAAERGAGGIPATGPHQDDSLSRSGTSETVPMAGQPASDEGV